MVVLTRFCYRIVESRQRGFLERVRLCVRGGPGGQGIPRLGAIGGRGGDVYIRASKDSTLLDVLKSNPNRRVKGGAGENSRPRLLNGYKGTDVYINVPLGICVMNDSNEQITELNKEGETMKVAAGGNGGRPTNLFSGCSGEQRFVKLQLKLIADVGLVGFPNAGKSTLLKAVSGASPKIASYPFTTLRPQLGVIPYDDYRQISVVDLPGLVEGAHENVGMGHRFLKHIERTRLLLFMIDINGFQLSDRYQYRTVTETIDLLTQELELYKSSLLNKPTILAVNKIDTVENTTEILDEIKNEFDKFGDIIAISAQTGAGLPQLKQRIRQILDEDTTRDRGQTPLPNISINHQQRMLNEGTVALQFQQKIKIN